MKNSENFRRSEFIMIELAVQAEEAQKNIQSAVYQHPGDCDQFISNFIREKDLDRLHVENLKIH
jgi:ADP-sugar diphosphatase